MSNFDFLNTRELIIGLRGGIPPKCDYCDKDTEPDKLEPEEGDTWVCWECLDRWDAQDKASGVQRHP